MENTSEELASLRRQLAEAQENLRIVREQQSKFVLETDIPIELTKNERRLKRQIVDLERRIAELEAQAIRQTAPQSASSRQPRLVANWAWLFLIGGLNLLAGVLGNLIAAWIQQDLLSNVFTLPRIAAILLMTVVVLVTGALIQHQSSLSSKSKTAIIAVIVVLTAFVAITFPILSPGSSSFDYAVQVQEKNTGESIPNAEVRVDIGGGKPPLSSITDSSGFVTFSIDTSLSGQRAVLIVEATGYEKRRQEINLTPGHSAQVIQLKPTP